MKTYILSGKRTPQGSFLGQLASVPAPQLAATAINAAIEAANIDRQEIEEVFMGQVLSAGVGQAPARQAALAANIPDSVPATTINKVCGSGLKAIICAVQAIKCGDINLALACGAENMSLAPHLLQIRNGVKYGETSTIDSLANDALTDPYTGNSMGLLAEECPREYKISREEQDEYAIRSFMKAQKACSEGAFDNEIAEVTIQDHKGGLTVVSKDEGPGKVKYDKIKTLRPAFLKDGTITAASSSTINDGAAAIIIGNDKYKDKAEFEILSYASYAHSPNLFTTAPIGAIKLALKNASLSIEDIDLFEVNEAFACVPLAAMKELKIPEEKLNIYGSGISLGHPVGASGTRIVVTLMNALKRKNKELGLASLCIGGGEALSIIIKKI